MNSKVWNFKKYSKRLKALFKHPFFWLMTVLGNFCILNGAYLLYKFESQHPSFNLSLLDCILWSAGTVTTIGYGFIAQTVAGKITLLILMFTGTLFVWSYMGFLVTGLIAPDLASLETEVHAVEKEILNLEKKT